MGLPGSHWFLQVLKWWPSWTTSKFQREISLMHFSSATLSVLGWPRRLNGAPFSKELKQHIVKHQSALKCLMQGSDLVSWCHAPSFFSFSSLLYSIQGSHREDTGDYPAAYGWPMWALRVSPPCLRVPQQLSDGVLAPPSFNKNASQVLSTFQPSFGTWHCSTALTHLPTTFAQYWYIDRLSGPLPARGPRQSPGSPASLQQLWIADIRTMDSSVWALG